MAQFFIKCARVRHQTVMVQFPFTDGTMMICLRKLKQRGNKIVVLVHDIESIRQKRGVATDNQIFALADEMIVHTKPMEEALRKIGYKGKIHILDFFDYRSTLQIAQTPNPKGCDIVFAGNLEKSAFLTDLKKLENNEVRYLLYGMETKRDIFTKDIIYKGCFDSEQFADIEGDWGLVWDGSSIDTCNGELGEYLRINAPFKFSLYLAARKPVIVWSESAMAEYVKKYHLGITVNALSEIPKAISSLTESDCMMIKQGVDEWSENVRRGKMFGRIVEKLRANS